MGLGAFGDKLFEVSENKILTPSGISISESLNVEMQDTDGGKPATYIKGYNAMSISFDIPLYYAFCDVKAEIDWWILKMRNKTPEYLTLGDKTYGTNKMLLEDVKISDLLIAPNGKHLKASLSLSFSEWTSQGYKKDTNSSDGTTSGTAEKVIKVAEAEIGTRETGKNNQKYGKELGMNGVAWCGLFVAWCMKHGDVGLPKFNYASAAAYAYAAEKSGWGTYHAKGSGYTPKRGDIFVTNYRGRDFENDGHVGYVRQNGSGTTFVTVEGNSSSKVNTRTLNISGYTFVTPPY